MYFWYINNLFLFITCFFFLFPLLIQTNHSANCMRSWRKGLKTLLKYYFSGERKRSIEKWPEIWWGYWNRHVAGNGRSRGDPVHFPDPLSAIAGGSAPNPLRCSPLRPGASPEIGGADRRTGRRLRRQIQKTLFGRPAVGPARWRWTSCWSSWRLCSYGWPS